MHNSHLLGLFLNLLAVGLVGINNLAFVLSAEYVLLHLYKKTQERTIRLERNWKNVHSLF